MNSMLDIGQQVGADHLVLQPAVPVMFSATLSRLQQHGQVLSSFKQTTAGKTKKTK
jgi:hypothetical protein